MKKILLVGLIANLLIWQTALALTPVSEIAQENSEYTSDEQEMVGFSAITDAQERTETAYQEIDTNYSDGSTESCNEIDEIIDLFNLYKADKENWADTFTEVANDKEDPTIGLKEAKLFSDAASIYAKAIDKIKIDYKTPLCESDLMFIDVNELNTNYDAIVYLKENNIVGGYPDGSFKPNDEINRAELLKILVEGTGVSPSVDDYSDCFKDVKSGWFVPYVCYAKSIGWIDGYPDGTFRPSATVNKVEAIKMLLNSQNIDIPASVASTPFTDVPTDQWFAAYIKVASDMGILEETANYLQPGSNMKRGAVSENLYRLLTFDGEYVAVSHEDANDQNQPVVEDLHTIEDIALSGIGGKKVSEEFYLEEGLAIVDMSYSGESNFIVKLLSTERDDWESLANEIGQFEGKTAVNVPESGKYVLDLQTSGSWDITIKQPRGIKLADEIHSLDGNGTDVSDFVKIDDGLKKFHLKYVGDSNFIVHILDLNGEIVAFLANEIGSWEGETVENLDQGIYLFRAQTEGKWSIDFEDVDFSSATAQSSFSGKGASVTVPFSLSSGLKTFNLTHDGDSNFIVHLLDSNGSYGTSLANEIGEFDGSTAEYMDAGNYLLEIDADGEWTIEIE